MNKYQKFIFSLAVFIVLLSAFGIYYGYSTGNFIIAWSSTFLLLLDGIIIHSFWSFYKEDKNKNEKCR